MEKANATMKIEDLSGELIVYPKYYVPNDFASATQESILSIPEKVRTVQELRDEIDIHPENEEILSRVLKDIIMIFKEQNFEQFNKFGQTVEEVYNTINQMNPFNEALLYLRKYGSEINKIEKESKRKISETLLQISDIRKEFELENKDTTNPDIIDKCDMSHTISSELDSLGKSLDELKEKEENLEKITDEDEEKLHDIRYEAYKLQYKGLELLLRGIGEAMMSALEDNK